MKRSPILSMNDAIRDFFEENPDIHEKILERKAKLLVDKHFENLKKYIDAIFIKEGTIYMRVNSPNMRNYLLTEKEEIIRSINKEIGVYLISNIVIH